MRRPFFFLVRLEMTFPRVHFLEVKIVPGEGRLPRSLLTIFPGVG